jgi:hypothetical protein
MLSAFGVLTRVDHYSGLYVTVFKGEGPAIPKLLLKDCGNSIEAGLKADQSGVTADWVYQTTDGLLGSLDRR